jgi:hypothetical protein
VKAAALDLPVSTASTAVRQSVVGPGAGESLLSNLEGCSKAEKLTKSDIMRRALRVHAKTIGVAVGKPVRRSK